MVRGIPGDGRGREAGDEVGEELVAVGDDDGFHPVLRGALLLETFRIGGIVVVCPGRVVVGERGGGVGGRGERSVRCVCGNNIIG